MPNNLITWVSFIANLVQIAVGASAVILAYTQRKKISAAFSILFNYSTRASVAELGNLLQKLNDNSVENPETRDTVRITLAHIHGKIRGNETLQKCLGPKVTKPLKAMMDELDAGKPVSETSKASLHTEIKERIITIELETQAPKSTK